MIIINQDRDKSVVVHNRRNLRGQIVMKGKTFIGINLMFKNNILGTFDTMEEFTNELLNINNCKYECYVVNGFNDYENCFVEVD